MVPFSAYKSGDIKSMFRRMLTANVVVSVVRTKNDLPTYKPLFKTRPSISSSVLAAVTASNA